MEPPEVFSHTFRHVIPSLINRFATWDLWIASLIKCFEDERDAANSLCDIYEEASKSLSQTTVKRHIIDAMGVSKVGLSICQKAKRKLDKFTDSFTILGEKFNLDYASQGGVLKNLARMKDTSDQLCLFEIERRDFLLNEVLPKLERIRESVKKRHKELQEWKGEFDEARDMRESCVKEWSQLMEAVAWAKINRDITPLPQHDPWWRWKGHYVPLRDKWIDKMNNLQMAAVIHQQESKTVEQNLVESVRTILKDYVTTMKTRNLKIKTIFAQQVTPFDGQEEWTYFESHNNVIPTPPLGRALLPRQLTVQNQDHPMTKPMAVAMLSIESKFPYSFKSSKTPRRYVVTHGGFLLKASEDEMNDPIPQRGFRLADCNIFVGLPKNGKQSFAVRGVNCCKYSSALKRMTDRRTLWKFTGSEADVKAMLAVIQTRIPIVKYQYCYLN